MANGLLDYLSGFGSTPPEYLGGLLGQEAVDKLKGRAATTGIANAVLGYLAAPKNQNLGLGRIIGSSLQAGMQGAQGVYDNATQDYLAQQRIGEMQRKQAQQTQLQGMLANITDPNERLFAELNPSEYVKSKLTPTERKFEKIGNQLVDVTSGTPTVAFTGTTEAPFKVGQTRDYILGNKRITEEYQQDGTFKKIAEGSAFAPASQVNVNMPSESERTAGFLTSRLQNSLNQLQSVVSKNPKAAKPTIGAEAVKALTGSDYLTNLTNPEARQRIESAQLEILDSALTLGTGAAYTREQLQNYSKSYFPQLGDKPKNIADKQARLEALLKAAKIKGGRAAPEDMGLPPNVTVERVR
jgi:hypothetical protein